MRQSRLEYTQTCPQNHRVCVCSLRGLRDFRGPAWGRLGHGLSPSALFSKKMIFQIWNGKIPNSQVKFRIKSEITFSVSISLDVIYFGSPES